jgi:hypothetical protein
MTTNDDRNLPGELLAAAATLLKARKRCINAVAIERPDLMGTWAMRTLAIEGHSTASALEALA